MIVLSNNSVVLNVLFKNKSFLKYFDFSFYFYIHTTIGREEKAKRRADLEVEG